MVKKISYAAQRYCKRLDNFYKEAEIKDDNEDADVKATKAEPLPKQS